MLKAFIFIQACLVAFLCYLSFGPTVTSFFIILVNGALIAAIGICSIEDYEKKINTRQNRY